MLVPLPDYYIIYVTYTTRTRNEIRIIAHRSLKNKYIAMWYDSTFPDYYISTYVTYTRTREALRIGVAK
jgi:hypothetical protein